MFTPPLQPSRYQKWFNGKTVILLIIAIVGTAFVTRFFEKLHYDNLLQKSYTAQAHLSDTTNSEELDLKYLIDNTHAPLNCYQLMSSYARQLCAPHNQAQNQ